MKYLFRYTAKDTIRVRELEISGENFASCFYHFCHLIDLYDQKPAVVRTVRLIDSND